MLPRHAISDADWDRIKDLLPGRPGQPGWRAADNRRFIDAVLWIARTGAPWRDLPDRFGPWRRAVVGRSICVLNSVLISLRRARLAPSPA